MGYRRKILEARKIREKRKKLISPDNYAAAKRQCLGKAAYSSERFVITKINEIAEEGRRGLRYYECPFCGLYHISHKAIGGQQFIS